MAMTPKKIYQLADRYCESAVLQHAVAAGVFDLLQEPRTSLEVSKIKKWVHKKTEIFLCGLAALELVERNGEYFTNAQVTNDVLVRGKTGYLGDLVEHERLQWNLWSRVPEILKADELVNGQQDLQFAKDPYANDVFHRAMKQLSIDLMPIVIELPDWQHCTKVIDLAGGHGLYMCELAKKYTHLSGEIWDIGVAMQEAESNIQDYALSERIRFRSNDISNARNYENTEADGFMLNHCLHHFTYESVKVIIEAISKSLSSGGILTIFDVHLDQNRTSPAENAMFSVYMMVNTLHGEVHPTKDIELLLERNNFDSRVELLDNLEDDYLIVGRKR